MARYRHWILGVSLVAAAGASGPAQQPAREPAGSADLANTTATCQQPVQPPGLRTVALDSQGMSRSYVALVPRAHDGRSRLPVVLEFHGSGSNPRQQLAISGMEKLAERHGVVVLLPIAVTPYASGGHTWNVPPDPHRPGDVRFAFEVLEHASTWVCIDEQRVYAMGFSGGARLASQLACEAPDRLVAVAAVGGLRFPGACSEGSVAVIAFHGTADPINPYKGGGPAYWGASVESAVRQWTRRNRCYSVPNQTRISQSVTKLAYSTCETGEVVFYRIDAGGHTWPGSQFEFPSARFGSTTHHLDATEAIMTFFMNQTQRV